MSDRIVFEGAEAIRVGNSLLEAYWDRKLSGREGSDDLTTERCSGERRPQNGEPNQGDPIESDDKLCCPACLKRGMSETEHPVAARVRAATLKLHVDRLCELLSAPQNGLCSYASAIDSEIEAIRTLAGGLRPPPDMAWDDPRLAGAWQLFRNCTLPSSGVTEPLQRPKGDG